MIKDKKFVIILDLDINTTIYLIAKVFAIFYIVYKIKKFWKKQFYIFFSKNFLSRFSQLICI